jgi:hypothetical protein
VILRDPTDDDLEWMLKQAREVSEFQQEQFRRDGMIYDRVLKKIVIKEETDAA